MGEVRCDSLSAGPAADESPSPILSTLASETRRCDSRAFASLLRHVREKDSEQQTVLMVQVENEVGYLGRSRDRSPEANLQFQAPVPTALVQSLEAQAKQLQLSPELASRFYERGHTWSEVFGDAAMRSIAPLLRVSISTRPISTGPISNTGFSVIRFQVIRSSYPKPDSKAHPTMPTTLTARPGRSVFLLSALTVCAHRRMTNLNP